FPRRNGTGAVNGPRPVRLGERARRLPAVAGREAAYLRWRILARMRRFLRPTLRRPEPRRLLPMLNLLDLLPRPPRQRTRNQHYR
ncbi:MAG TPA: hypothetical protein VG013_18875, partial [Gemmataceae bacterium]|nr:hypothetical protein [Gemmataceae bacterium]